MLGRCTLPVLVVASAAAGQATLYAVRANGDLLRVDPATGAAQFVGSSGVACDTGGGILSNASEWMYTLGGDPSHPARLVSIDHYSGAVTRVSEISGIPAGYAPVGFQEFIILGNPDPLGADLLGHIDVYPMAACTVVATLSRSDLQALATDFADFFYGIAGAGNGTLCRINRVTGVCELMGPGGLGAGARAMVGGSGGLLVASGGNLLSVDPSSGGASVIGPMGYSDIRALAWTQRQQWYANCDNSWNPPPLLNVLDFNCFLVRFSMGDPYANCDRSTTPPTLNVLDFNCFMNCFVAACTAP
jgi:hypothetical protein